MRHFISRSIVVSVLLFGSALSASAGILNPEFNLPDSNSPPTSWASGPGTANVLGNIGVDSGQNSPNSTGGTGAAYTNDDLYQILSDTVASLTNYDLSADFFRYQTTSPTVTLQLYAADSGENLATATLLGSMTVTLGAPNTWVSALLSVSSATIAGTADTSSGSVIGDNLLVATTTSTTWDYSDHWNLTATAVPEPSSLMLVIAAITCGSIRRRRLAT